MRQGVGAITREFNAIKGMNDMVADLRRAQAEAERFAASGRRVILQGGAAEPGTGARPDGQLKRTGAGYPLRSVGMALRVRRRRPGHTGSFWAGASPARRSARGAAAGSIFGRRRARRRLGRNQVAKIVDERHIVVVQHAIDVGLARAQHVLELVLPVGLVVAHAERDCGS